MRKNIKIVKTQNYAKSYWDKYVTPYLNNNLKWQLLKNKYPNLEICYDLETNSFVKAVPQCFILQRVLLVMLIYKFRLKAEKVKAIDLLINLPIYYTAFERNLKNYKSRKETITEYRSLQAFLNRFNDLNILDTILSTFKEKDRKKLKTIVVFKTRRKNV